MVLPAPREKETGEKLIKSSLVGQDSGKQQNETTMDNI